MTHLTINFKTMSVNLGPGLYSAHETLRSLVLLCGTVCQLTFALHPFFCRLLLED